MLNVVRIPKTSNAEVLYVLERCKVWNTTIPAKLMQITVIPK